MQKPRWKKPYPSQEERDRAYRESREWLDEHGQEYAGKEMGILEPKVKGGGAKDTEEYKAYRESRKWLDEHGQEFARKEMEPAVKVIWDGTKWVTKEAMWKGAEVFATRYLPTILSTIPAWGSFLNTVFGEWLNPPLAHAPTSEEDITGAEKSKK